MIWKRMLGFLGVVLVVFGIVVLVMYLTGFSPPGFTPPDYARGGEAGLFGMLVGAFIIVICGIRAIP